MDVFSFIFLIVPSFLFTLEVIDCKGHHNNGCLQCDDYTTEC